MLPLPGAIIEVLRHFESGFSARVWDWAQVLVIGAVLVFQHCFFDTSRCVTSMGDQPS